MLELLFKSDNIKRRDMYYTSMDAANERLLSAMDPFLHRLYRLSENAAEGLDHLLSFFTHDRTGCNSYLRSPYVLSLVPEPAYDWMGCMETSDCLVKCLVEFSAFDNALLQLQGSGPAPSFKYSMAINVESHLSDPYTVREDNYPPFEMIGMLEAVELGVQHGVREDSHWQVHCFGRYS